MGNAEEEFSGNPLFFDYGDDEDDETRLAEQKKLREEQEEKVRQEMRSMMGKKQDNQNAQAPVSVNR